MVMNEKGRTRFSLNDLPKASTFEKGGVKQPVFGRTFQQVQPPQQQPAQSAATPPPRFTLGGSPGFSPHQFRVKVPEFKSTEVKKTVGMQGEAKRAFKPLVQSSPTKGITRDR